MTTAPVPTPRVDAPPSPPEVATGRVARNALHLVGGQVATTALAIAFSAALGRFLGAADFGVYFLVATMSAFAYEIVSWGQGLFLVREVARTPASAGALLGTALALRAAGALVVLLPTAIVAWALGYEPRTRWLALAFMVASLPFFLAQAFGMVFRGRDMMARDAVVSTANKALTLALALPVLLLHQGIPGVLAAQALAGLGAIAVARWLYRRIRAPRLQVTREAGLAILAGGAPIVALSVTASVQSYVDAIVLSQLAPEAAVGWFGAARNLMGTLIAPSAILASAAYPSLSRVTGDVAAFRMGLRSGLRPLLWLGALGGVGTYLFADLAIALTYGSKGYAPAATILKVYAPALFLLFVDVFLAYAITASGRAKAFAIVKAASIVVSTTLSLYLVPRFQAGTGNGGIGLVVAFAVSELVVFGFSPFLLPRRSVDPALGIDAGRAIAAAGATLLLFHALPVVPPYLAIPLCVVVFSLASLAFGLVTRRDLQTLKALLGRVRPAPAGRPPS